MEPRLKTHYENHVRPKLLEEFGFVNPNQIPKVVKVVLNVGVGDASRDQKLLESAIDELGIIEPANQSRTFSSEKGCLWELQ